MRRLVYNLSWLDQKLRVLNHINHIHFWFKSNLKLVKLNKPKYYQTTRLDHFWFKSNLKLVKFNKPKYYQTTRLEGIYSRVQGKQLNRYDLFAILNIFLKYIIHHIVLIPKNDQSNIKKLEE
jgi:hypothetical protein